jgi:hypothetical protein
VVYKAPETGFGPGQGLPMVLTIGSGLDPLV